MKGHGGRAVEALPVDRVIEILRKYNALAGPAAEPGK